MAVERRGPAVCNDSNKKEGKGDMTKTPISLQDLRRSLYIKAKAEPAWRFWGLYVHVCKRETLHEAYRMAKKNDGAPGIDGVTFEAIEESGVESFLQQIRDELVSNTYRPMRARKKEIPKDGGTKSASSRFPRSATAWFRERSSSSWSRSSKLISNRGRMDTDRNGQRMKRCTEWLKRLIREKPASSILTSEPTSTMCSTSCCWRRWPDGSKMMR